MAVLPRSVIPVSTAYLLGTGHSQYSGDVPTLVRM